MLRFLLLFQILYTVYQGHYNFESGVPGLNLPNALFLLVLLTLRFSGKSDEVHAKALMRGPLLFFMAMLVLAFAIAQMRAPGVFMVDLTYLKNALFSPLLYFMYLHCKQDLKNTRLLVIAVMVVAGVAAVQAIRQGFDYGIGTYVETHRAAGPFGSNYRDANRAGVYYAMFLPMFIALALMMRRQWRWRVAALAGIAVLAAAILFTYSRQSYAIALLAAALLFARRHVVLAALMAVVFVGLIDYLPESVTERVAETHQESRPGGDQYDVSTESRWKIWHGAMGMLQDNPQGIGLNRFQTQIGHYVPEYAGYDAHNFYVLTVCECGILGLLALGWLITRLFALAGRLRRSAGDDDEAHALATGFTVTVLSMDPVLADARSRINVNPVTVSAKGWIEARPQFDRVQGFCETGIEIHRSFYVCVAILTLRCDLSP